MRAGAYVPPRVEDFGTLADLTAAHALLPTQTPLAAVTSLSAPSSNGGTFGAPSAGGGPTAPTNVVSGAPAHGHAPGTAFGGHHGAASHGHAPAHVHAPVAGIARPVGGGHAGGSLPFTGFAATVLGAFGAALTAIGVLLRRMDRRRSSQI